MADFPHKKTLNELKSEAFAKLERLGYDVRGKTPAQIRNMLKVRPPRRWASNLRQNETIPNPGQGFDCEDRG
jgi:hypothetical protein